MLNSIGRHLAVLIAEKDWQPKPEIDTGHHNESPEFKGVFEMHEELLIKLQPMTRDEVEAYWPEVDKIRDEGKITQEEYKDLCDYCFSS